jgi:PhnB protein
MLIDDFPKVRGGVSMMPKASGGTPVTIHLTVTDVDARLQRAIRRGRHRGRRA